MEGFEKINETQNIDEEKLKEISEKINKTRLCVPFTNEEIKKLEISYNFKYNANKRSLIANLIHDKVMKEVEEILKEMKEKFFKEV